MVVSTAYLYLGEINRRCIIYAQYEVSRVYFGAFCLSVEIVAARR
jgi:hypothetical protein